MRFLAGTALAVSLAAALPAGAEIVTLNLSGSVEGGTAFAGQSVTGLITYDTATLPHFTGAYFLPAGSLSITVDGRTFSSGIDTYAQSRDRPLSVFIIESNRLNLSISEYVGVNFFAPIGSDLYFSARDLPTADQLAGLDVRFQVAYISETGYVSGYGSLRALSVENAPVPEPATWAMMIVGFGAVGGSLRRRRTQASMLAA